MSARHPLTGIIAGLCLVATACVSRSPSLPLYMPPPGTALVPVSTQAREIAPAEVPMDSIRREDPRADGPIVTMTVPEEIPEKPEPIQAAPLALASRYEWAPRTPDKARIPSVGTVRALVLPISVEEQRPSWSQEEIAHRAFGDAGLAAEIMRVSDGFLTFEADVFPILIDPDVTENEITRGDGAERHLTGLTRRLLSQWAETANLAQYDNNGPDEIPMSDDDDGVVDLLYVAVESAEYPALMSVNVKQDIRVGENQRLRLRVENAQIYPLPTGARKQLDLRAGVMQFLATLGVDPHNSYFPGAHSDEIATATRVRLGWSASIRVTDPGYYRTDDNHGTLIFPHSTRGKDAVWMIERRSASVWVSEVDLRGGQYETRSVTRIDDPSQPLVLDAGTERAPLSLSVEWDRDSMGLEVTVRDAR